MRTRLGEAFTRMCHLPLAACTVLPTSCPRPTLNSSPRKTLECANLLKMCWTSSLPCSRLFNDPAPSRNCPRHKATKSLACTLAFCDLDTAVQLSPLNLWFPEYIPGSHTWQSLWLCLISTQPPRLRSDTTSSVKPSLTCSHEHQGLTQSGYQVMLDI